MLNNDEDDDGVHVVNKVLIFTKFESTYPKSHIPYLFFVFTYSSLITKTIVDIIATH